jgi:hypothetical protein
MPLLLCDRNDLSALWLYERLRRRELALELVTSELLAYALGWEHRLTRDSVSIAIELADGRTLNGEGLELTINRLGSLPAGIAAGAHARDREYALQELHAFWLSWLAALPGRVLNRPSGRGLAGPWLDRTEWLVLAARAGLPTVRYDSTAPQTPVAGRTVLVVCGQLAQPAAPQEIVVGCRSLAELSETDLLGVEFTAGNGWAFQSASPLPDLRVGGELGVDLIERALRGGR